LLSSSMFIGKASAMPASGLAFVAKHTTDGLQEARWVCGPYRCWWRPGPYWGGPYWGPPRYHRWGWHRWGWHRRWG
jgi:hypothetical protein